MGISSWTNHENKYLCTFPGENKQLCEWNQAAEGKKKGEEGREGREREGGERGGERESKFIYA